MISEMQTIVTKLTAMERQLAAASDSRLDAFTGLLQSIESSLADIVDNVERGGGAAAIEALAGAIKAMKLSAPDVSVKPQITVQPAEVPVNVMVPEQPAPVVNVRVEPTPITVEAEMPAPVVQVMPAPAGPVVRSLEIRIPAEYGRPARTITIVPTYME